MSGHARTRGSRTSYYGFISTTWAGMQLMVITSFQEASNEVAVANFCNAYNFARYTSCIMINDGLHFTATCYSTLNQLDVEEREVPWDAILYIIAHTLL